MTGGGVGGGARGAEGAGAAAGRAGAVDVFGLGQAAYDHLLLVPRFPGPDEKVEGRDLTRSCGGPVATALVALSRWGRRCEFAGVIGEDDAGRAIREDLTREGVAAPGLLVRRGARSQEAFVTVREGTGERRICWQRPTGPAPAPHEVDPPPARVFLTDGLFAEASVALARRPWRVVVDAGTLREGTEALLGLAEVFVASESFARAFLGRDDPALAVERILARGPAVAAVTLGERGHVAGFDGRLVVGAARAVRVVDTTGCGDVFHAGVVEGLLAGWAWERAFAFASWAAGASATRLGARAGIPSRSSWETFSG